MRSKTDIPEVPVYRERWSTRAGQPMPGPGGVACAAGTGYHETRVSGPGAHSAQDGLLMNFIAGLAKCGWTIPAGVPASLLADNLLDLDAAQGLDAVSYQMQQLLPLYALHLTTFHIDENESRHLVGDFKLRFAGNLNIDSFSHFAPR